MRKHGRLLAALVVVLGNIASASAQSYPSRPITMVVPFPAGGATDTIARIIAERMRTSLGQPVIVENVAGAAGSIGVGRVARAAPDGYTLGHRQLGHACGQRRHLPAAVRRAERFRAGRAARQQPAADRRARRPAGERPEGLIAWLKANPDKASQGTPAPAARRMSRGVLFQKADRHALPVRALSRRRSGDAGPGRRADRHDDRPGRRALAAGARRHDQGLCGHGQDARLAAAPDIPTVDEAGLPGLLHLGLACALGAQGHAEGRHRQAQRRGRRGAGRSGGAQAARRPRPGDSSARAADAGGARRLHKAEIEKWWPIIKAAGIKPE